ncbi:indole-3-glycerol phosphate synthase TrpC [Magnetococcales bacterium HHB-1]
MSHADTVLDRIFATKKEEVKQRKQQRSESELLDQILYMANPKGFARQLKRSAETKQPAIIAEVKFASPSKGRIYEGSMHAAAIAKSYQSAGATCISCLTDESYFQGSDLFLTEIRQQCDLPLLRKDFLFSPYQVLEARLLGADAILLIMAMLSQTQAQELEATALEVGLDVLVETHTQEEVEQAHLLQTPLIGINNRNLHTFSTDLNTSITLSKKCQSDRLVIAESGIHTVQHIHQLQQAEIHSFLIGERFMRSDDPGTALQSFIEAI